MAAAFGFACVLISLGSVSPLRAEPGDAPVSVERKGVAIEFSATPVAIAAPSGQEADVEEFDVSFRILDAATRQPLTKRRPGAWIDAGVSPLSAQSGACKEKIDSFLKSGTGARPIVDLTSYYILAFNRDASVSVIDPLVGISGRSNLLATIALSGPPGDWTKSLDGKRLYVTIPSAGKVAVIDSEGFKLLEEVETGGRPMRIALSADAAYIFVADDADGADGLTVISAADRKIAARIPTGQGHHELVLSQSGELLFVSNRGSGDVAVIDAVALKLVGRVQTGATPIALAYSRLAQALYVADGTDGTVTVIDGRAPRIIGRIEARPGLGPIAISPDERWALVVNASRNLVHVIEIATNRLVQDISVGSRPYQIAFSEAFAYIVSLDAENVGMISLKDLGKATAERVSSFAAGASPPVNAPELGVGASVARAVDDAAVVVANPADNMIYYYMEGMLAPSGSFLNPGREVRAVGVLDHGLKETAPGVYSARARLPRGGSYQAAIMLDSPRAFECFPLQVAKGPDPAQTRTTIDYLAAPAVSRTKETVSWRFRLSGPKRSAAAAGASVTCFSAVGAKPRLEIPAREVEEGVFEARLAGLGPGAYYVYVAAPSLGIVYGDLPPRNLLVYPRD